VGHKGGPAVSKSHSKASFPSINWIADDSALLWSLMSEMEKKDNSKVLFGQKKKNKVCLPFYLVLACLI
jgi:hypothetical protein